MTPMVLSALGAFLLLLLWSLTLPRATMARIACAMSLATCAHLAISGQFFQRDAELSSPITVHGVDDAGDPVLIDVVLKAQGREPRSVRRVPVSASIPAGPWLVAILGSFGLLGLFILGRDEERWSSAVLGALSVGPILILGVAWSMPSGGAGNEWVREYLSMNMPANAVESFRPPQVGWSYPTLGLPTALLLLGVIGSTLVPRLSEKNDLLEPLLTLAALCVLGAFAWNAWALGGFVWGGQDGALCVQAIGAAAGISLTTSPGNRGLIFALVSTMAAAGLA